MEKAPQTVLFTIGYEGAEISSFIRTLIDNKVKLLVDVREVSVSRRPRFSKSKLRAHLAEFGIDYMHIRSLGDPKPGRVAARAGDYQAFRRIYGEHLCTSEAQLGLDQLRTVVSTQRTCLMCYESDPTNCHRAIIAENLKKCMLTRIDLFVDRGSRHGHTNPARDSDRFGKGATAP